MRLQRLVNLSKQYYFKYVLSNTGPQDTIKKAKHKRNVDMANNVQSEKSTRIEKGIDAYLLPFTESPYSLPPSPYQSVGADEVSMLKGSWIPPLS